MTDKKPEYFANFGPEIRLLISSQKGHIIGNVVCFEEFVSHFRVLDYGFEIAQNIGFFLSLHSFEDFLELFVHFMVDDSFSKNFRLNVGKSELVFIKIHWFNHFDVFVSYNRLNCRIRLMRDRLFQWHSWFRGQCLKESIDCWWITDGIGLFLSVSFRTYFAIVCNLLIFCIASSLVFLHIYLHISKFFFLHFIFLLLKAFFFILLFIVFELKQFSSVTCSYLSRPIAIVLIFKIMRYPQLLCLYTCALSNVLKEVCLLRDLKLL